MRQLRSEDSRFPLKALLCSPLPIPPSPSFYFPWTITAFLMTLSVTPAYTAKPLESYLGLPSPWSLLPKRNRFQMILCSLRQLTTSPSKRQLNNLSGFKPRVQSNNFLHITISFSQGHWFHGKHQQKIISDEVIRFDVMAYYYFFLPQKKYPWNNNN